MKRTIILVLLFINLHYYAQVAEEKQPILKTGGGIAFQTSFGYEDNFEWVPFKWSISGQLTTTLKGWAIPITGSYTNRTFSYTHPFNKLGLSPHYKWIKLHGGYCSMNWSPLLLGGETFLGGGIELSPGPWKIIGFYGKFTSGYPGGGISAGYSRKGFEIGLSGIQIEDNQAATLQMKFPIQKTWVFTAEQSISVFPNSEMLFATKAGISRKGKQLNSSIDYQRIDPGYRTLGVPFISNDEENIQLNLQGSINARIKYTFSLGGMRKGIYANRIQSSYRIIQSAGITYQGKNGFSIQINSGNFATESFQTQEIDPEHLFQINSTIGTKLSYSRKKKTVHSNFSLQVQQSSGKTIKSIAPISFENYIAESPTSIQQSLQLTYSAKRKITYQITTNINKIVSINTETFSFGPGFSLSTSTNNNQTKWSLSGSLQRRVSEKMVGNTFLQEKLNVSRTLLKKPQLQCGVNLAFTQSFISQHDSLLQKMQGQINISSSF